ncbi:hypothetical protein V8E54_001812 [Elaphomyces granulatus]
MYVYDPNCFAPYKDRWVTAAESTMSHFASSPTSRPDMTFRDVYNNGTYSLEPQHLACFAGGNFLVGREPSQPTNNPSIVLQPPFVQPYISQH